MLLKNCQSKFMMPPQLPAKKKDARNGHPFLSIAARNSGLEFMAFHTLIALLKVLLMRCATFPGFGSVAVVAQIAFRFDQAGGLTSVTAHA